MNAKIAKALHEVMTKVSYVQKGGVNKFHGYKYAGEADLLAVLRPAMIEAGLLLLPSVVECRPVDEHGNTTVIMEYTLAHKDGDVWPHPIRMAGTGHDKTKTGVQDKGTYKAITGANKYLLFKLFQIETGDDPEHAAGPGTDDGPHDLTDASGTYRRDPPSVPPPPYPAARSLPPPPAGKPGNGTRATASINADTRQHAAETFVAQSIETFAKMPNPAEGIAAFWNNNSRHLEKLQANYPVLYDRLTTAADAAQLRRNPIGAV